MKKYLLFTDTDETEKNGGPKMVMDMVATASNAGYELMPFYTVKGLNTTVANLFEGLRAILKIVLTFRKDDIVLIQFPMNREMMCLLYGILRLTQVHTITMVHDIDYLRKIPLRNKGVTAMKELELYLLNKTEYLICPNQAMIDQLRKDGVMAKFVSQEVSDYMYTGSGAERTNDNTIIVAGNLLEDKAGYLYKLDDQKFKLSLYGANLGKSFCYENATYNGAFPPSALIDNLRGDYGLVWDGPEIDCCDGPYGNYQRYNNPHKLSLYLAAGIPVIVWKNAALSRFVEENGVGYSVNTLNDIDEQLTKHNPNEFVANVTRVGAKIRAGGYLLSALKKIEKSIDGNER